MTRRSNRKYLRDLALQRIKRLVMFAEQVRTAEPELANRYGELALAIARKAQLHYPDFLKARVCRRCGAWLILGATARVRLRRRGKMKYVAVTCLNCGYVRRYPLKRQKVPPRPWYTFYRAHDR
uniref:Ribonuclease P protein component 4 n=1 Tax=Thermofilum pendens TaxID=2269 RepID=A0A7C4B9N1_THEPE